jgi:hypothetical protein
LSNAAIFACAFFFVAGFAVAEIWAELRIVMADRRIQRTLRPYWKEHLRGPRALIKLIQRR